MEQSLALFQKRDDLDELEGFQQQELAKVKHMVRVQQDAEPQTVFKVRFNSTQTHYAAS